MASPGRDAVEVVVSEDRMRASIRVDAGRAPSGVEVAEVLAALDAAGIDGVDARRVIALANAWGRVTCHVPVVVAEGLAATPGAGAQCQITLPSEQWGRVEAGDVLGTWQAGTPGRDGRDVCGRRLRATLSPERHRLGLGVCVDEDGVLRAMGRGRLVHYPDGTIAVVGLTRVEGDLKRLAGAGKPGHGTAAGEEYPGDLEVSGAVSVAGLLAVGGTLSVQGPVEARRVECGEDLLTSGGLLGSAMPRGATRGEMSVYAAGRDLRCRFATGCRLEAGSGIVVRSDLMHCEVVCGGRLEVGERLQGCVVVATGGIVCRSAGNTARQVTVLEAGTDPGLRELAVAVLPGLENPLQKMEHGRLTIRPLLERQRLLTPAQREQAARFIDETSRLERDVLHTTTALRERYVRWRAAAVEAVEVLDVIAGGVIVRFPGLEATVSEPLRGPVRLRPDHSQGDPRVVVTDLRSGALTYLAGRMVSDPVFVQLRKVMGKLAA